MLLRDLDATRAFAHRLALALPEGALVLLTGPMGAGKTTLVKFLAEALGFEGEVTSPTYTLIHEYPTPQGPIVHIDAYRLADQEELFSLGLEDYLPEARCVLVEWGKPEVFPDSLEVRLTPQNDTRQASLIPHAPAYREVAERFNVEE
ncbi:tRNA (adenosine(37)-N6)-threonylcarbamoyltransferase complex ATPase subunit type 1 TsaE [Calidithermus roseus]|uniref:tRNA threonylcarbamoyladenosine biosynthesis protein TsaE n=1 Tax=Calidithermus roseus TaxID=1644118 RepID=A0A399ENT5_9DEIN|nr:tRNA (adenosine(37)-N6)-threonylcarbamoyltransferase complex ATPase subunit type 1 TsaE [Calidithermus roseus]RIH86287.1 tRNA threonylcarbamoyladenosine biosynthesis protein TsaE [Calidithermus roseus]